MTRATRLAKTRDGLRENLDLSTGGRQLLALRIVAETTQLSAIVRLLRHDQAIACPEFIEAWRRQAPASQNFPGRLIQVLQPLADRATFGEGFADAEAFGEIREDR